jgi:2-polyprenyl-3-methyl-5-hydroxy-6-metoxy-1,4-benzoquinol methylase
MAEAPVEVTGLPASEFDRRMAALGDDDVWSEYYAPRSLARLRRQALLREVLDARRGERVLDVGCGAGSLAFWAASQGAHVVGLDYSAASVAAAARVARRLGDAAPRHAVADALALPVRDGRFDKVISVDVLDVTHAATHATLLRGLLAAARSGGSVYVYTPNGRRERVGRAIRPLRRLGGRWRGGESSLHIGLTTAGRLAALFRELGVSAHVRYADMNYPWLARVPLVRRWLAGHMLWTIRKPAG